MRLSYPLVVIALLLPAPARALTHSVIPLRNTDMVMRPSDGLLVVASPGTTPEAAGSLVAIDPATEAVVFTIPVGPEPQRLALADDGLTLYVALLSDTIQVVDLGSRSVTSSFWVGIDPFNEGLRAEDLAVQPGQPNVLAVSLRYAGSFRSPRHFGVAIFERGVRRPVQAIAHTGSNRVLFSSTDPARLYGVCTETTPSSFFRLAVASTGVAIVDETRDLVEEFFTRELQHRDGRIYTNRGQILSPEPPSALGRFALPVNDTGRMGATLALDDTRAWFLTNSAEIFAFDLATGNEWIHHALPLDLTPGRRLARWGTSGLAYIIPSFEDQPAGVVLVRDIENPAVTDVAVTVRDHRDPATQGEVLDYQVVVRNLGKEAAADVVLRDTLPEGTILRHLIVQSILQIPEDSSGVVVRALGTLAPGDSVTVRIGVEPTRLGVIRNAAGITTATLDSNPDNNQAAEETVIREPGWDHIDLWSRIEAPGTVAPGTFEYAVVVGKQGPAEAVQFFLYHNWPSSSFEPVSASTPLGSCDVGFSSVNCTFPSLPPGDSTIVRITAVAAPGGRADLYSEMRSWTQTDGNRLNDDDTLHIEVVDAPAVDLDSLTTWIEEAALPAGIERKLIALVEEARVSLEEGRPEDACRALGELETAIARLPRPHLSEQEAEELVAGVGRVATGIGCAGNIRRLPLPGPTAELTLRSSGLEPVQRLQLTLPDPRTVKADVFDVTGRLVRSLDGGPRESGVHVIAWDGRGNDGLPRPPGVYFVRVVAGDLRQVRRVLLMQ